MRVDLEYMKSFLAVFLESDKAHIDYNDIASSGLDIHDNDKLSEKFIFHLQLILDNRLLGINTGFAHNLKDLGFHQSISGETFVGIIPWRLTQKGHDFASTLNNKEVFVKLKSEFKDAPFQVIFDGGQKLFQHFMKKKMDSLLAE
ncbi:DUF2513 domain-containing protein [Pseudoalteromonas arctica]|uniref:DUF2513 domain-containing protein n=1 Tax=Pseudoalteromonas arctica TaxID=394751 RepID=UPI001C9CF752|nr:DUF2513 domain-containing protein [Pseudoalteromonas arctica]MBZ2193292.1 DUF2513 domain-containing protein [Pseudoalteromonas arctica]